MMLVADRAPPDLAVVKLYAIVETESMIYIVMELAELVLRRLHELGVRRMPAEASEKALVAKADRDHCASSEENKDEEDLINLQNPAK